MKVRKPDPLPALTLAFLLAATAFVRGLSEPPAAAPGPPLPWRPDLNRAPARHLVLLPGVGPVRARAIVEERPFAGVDDLQRVKGIGPATVELLRGRVEVR